jgi:biotin carboxyl carrier protein
MRLVVKGPAGEEEVAVERRGDGYEVRIGDRTYRVDAAPVGDGHRSLLIDGCQHEVVTRPSGEGGWSVSAGGATSAVEVSDPLSHLARKSRCGPRGGGRQEVKAYMPGRVVALLVDEGAAVEAGQGVVVLEAMKMENEIRAERAGTVTRLHVAPGQSVEGGDPLFEIE